MLELVPACAIISSDKFVLALFSNSLWIVGLALLLASFGYHYEQATRQKQRLRIQLGRRSFVTIAWIALALIAAGLAGSSRQGWEAIVWVVLTVISGWQAVTVWRSTEREPED